MFAAFRMWLTAIAASRMWLVLVFFAVFLNCERSVCIVANIFRSGLFLWSKDGRRHHMPLKELPFRWMEMQTGFICTYGPPWQALKFPLGFPFVIISKNQLIKWLTECINMVTLKSLSISVYVICDVHSFISVWVTML